jgi:hypothetical protein
VDSWFLDDVAEVFQYRLTKDETVAISSLVGLLSSKYFRITGTLSLPISMFPISNMWDIDQYIVSVRFASTLRSQPFAILSPAPMSDNTKQESLLF